MILTSSLRRKLVRLWPLSIDLWLLAVVLTFLILRVIGSQTVQNLLKRSTAH
jgi:hypothetical protein